MLIRNTYYKCEGSILQGKRHPPSEYVYVQQIYIIQQYSSEDKKVLDSSSETWTFATTFSVILCNADPPTPPPSHAWIKREKDYKKKKTELTLRKDLNRRWRQK